MHGLGNDFVVLDARGAAESRDPAETRALADRRTGIGFDQLLIVGPARDPSCIAAYSIRNADGSPAQQCGNGVRCLAAWLHRDGVVGIDTLVRLQGPAGQVELRLLDARTVAVDMGEPSFDPARVPVVVPIASDRYALAIDHDTLDIGAVSMGNPHAVLEVGDVHDPRVDRLGPRITNHPLFPEGANAGFAQVVGAHAIRLRVHERGAGWTRACGSGACAAVAVLRRWGRVDEHVRVELPGGGLAIDWPGPGRALWMTGPADFVFDGELSDTFFDRVAATGGFDAKR
jgi:diaminopimelate epimerase